MLDANKLKADILSDMRVELSDEFDRNFERKAFFSDKWKPRAHDYPRGSLLVVTGAMRRSTRGEVSGDGVRFTSSEPYTTLHNEGGNGYKQVKSHTRRSKKGKTYTVSTHKRKFNMPQRQFIGGIKDIFIFGDIVKGHCKSIKLSSWTISIKMD